MRVYDTINPQDRTMTRALASQAAHIGDAVWMMSGDRRVTFAQADDLVTRYANGLAAMGVEKGDTVTMMMDPSIEVVLIALAMARLGGIFTNISTDYRGAFLIDSLDECMSQVLIVDGGFVPHLRALPTLGPCSHVFVLGEWADPGDGFARPLSDLLDHGDAPITTEVRWTDPMQVWWSSGTTGKSKGVLHTHGSLIHLARYYAMEHRPGDALYACTPMYVGSAWNGSIWRSLIAGLPVGIDARFSVSNFWDRTRFYGATHIFTLGAMHIHLLQAPPDPRDRDNPVRGAECVPMPYALMPQFKERFAVETMDQCWGQSETTIVTRARDDGTQWAGNAIGLAQPFYDVRILDDDDCEVPVGAVGEICCRPLEPNIMFAGYFNQPGLTMPAWRNLWHHSGDMGYRDEAGVFYFADRKKDYIRYKGRNISMFEVEGVVNKHPDVRDVAAFGIESEELETESELMIAVVLTAGSTVTPEDLARFINDNAPYYFVPRYIDLADSLPRNTNGKLMKMDLRERGTSEKSWDRDASGFAVKR